MNVMMLSLLFLIYLILYDMTECRHAVKESYSSPIPLENILIEKKIRDEGWRRAGERKENALKITLYINSTRGKTEIITLLHVPVKLGWPRLASVLVWCEKKMTVSNGMNKKSMRGTSPKWMLDGLCTAEVDKGYNKLFTDHIHLN